MSFVSLIYIDWFTLLITRGLVIGYIHRGITITGQFPPSLSLSLSVPRFSYMLISLYMQSFSWRPEWLMVYCFRSQWEYLIHDLTPAKGCKTQKPFLGRQCRAEAKEHRLTLISTSPSPYRIIAISLSHHRHRTIDADLDGTLVNYVAFLIPYLVDIH